MTTLTALPPPTLDAQHADLVYAAALRQARDPHAAADITQAVFLLLTRKRAARRAPPDSRLAAWLLTVTAYTVKAHARAQRRRSFHERRLPAPQEQPPMNAADDPLLPHLDAALLHLSPLDREVLSRRYLQDQPIAAIAAAVDLSENTAGRRIACALDKLRRRLARKGITALSAPALVALLLTQSRVHALPPAGPPSPTVILLAKSVHGRLAMPRLAALTTLSTAAVLTALLLAAPHLHLFAAPPPRPAQAPALPVRVIPSPPTRAVVTSIPAAGHPVTVFSYDPATKSFSPGHLDPITAVNTHGAELELAGISAQLHPDRSLTLTTDLDTDVLTLDLTTLPWPDQSAVAATLQKLLAPLTRPHLALLVTGPDPSDDQLALLWPLLHARTAGRHTLLFLGTTTLTSASLLSPATAPAPSGQPR